MTALDADTTRAILGERARSLARRVERAPVGDELNVVAFSIGDETFRIEASYVREVVRLRHLARVPGAPAAVRGVTTYRGEILAAVDVRAMLGRADGGLADLLWVVVGSAAPELGLLADEVVGVTRIRVDELRPVSEDSSAATRRLARAVTADAALVLDGEALLADLQLFAARDDASAGDAGA